MEEHFLHLKNSIDDKNVHPPVFCCFACLNKDLFRAKNNLKSVIHCLNAKSFVLVSHSEIVILLASIYLLPTPCQAAGTMKLSTLSVFFSWRNNHSRFKLKLQNEFSR
jgi:hypothetical protein